MAFFFDVCREMVVVKELLDVSARWNEVKALYILESSAWVGEVRCLAWAVFIHERCFIGGFDVGEEGNENEKGPCLLVCCERLVLVEGDIGDHSAYAVIVKIYQVDVCDSNAADSVDDCVEFVGGVGVKREGAGGRHSEASGAAVSCVGSVLGEWWPMSAASGGLLLVSSRA